MSNTTLDEFGLIAQYFKAIGPQNNVDISLGDDAAVLSVPVAAPAPQLVMCADTMVAERHFLPDADPSDLGWKILAVNLSDLAAMGAAPQAFTLALTLPTVDPAWLEAFSGGLRQCAEAFGVGLVGGDTTRGPLTMTVNAIGWVPAGQAVRRSGAQHGDGVYVRGAVGLAAAGLDVLRGRCDATSQLRDTLVAAHARPIPRCAAGQAVRQTASAMIDLSDGLVQDLGHILNSSGCGASLDLAALATLAPELDELDVDLATKRAWQLAGGDDYALLATSKHDLSGWTKIGVITQELGVTNAETGESITASGFRHF